MHGHTYIKLSKSLATISHHPCLVFQLHKNIIKNNSKLIEKNWVKSKKLI